MDTSAQQLPDSVPTTVPLDSLPSTRNIERLPEPVGKRYVLEEWRRAFDSITQTSSALDQKLQSLLSSASLIIALAGVIQLSVLKQAGGLLFWIVLIATLALYIAMVSVILWGLRPLKYLDPIDSKWEVLALRYFDEPEDHVLEYLIGDYITFTSLNRDTNEQKSRALRLAIYFFFATVVITVISIPFSV